MTTAHPYPVPSCVLDEEQVERYLHRDLGQFDDAALAHELGVVNAAVATIPRACAVDREWWVARRVAVLAELRRRSSRP